MRKRKRGVVGAALVLGALCVGAAPSHAEGWHRGGWGRGPRVSVNVGVGPYGYGYGYGPPRAAWRGWGRPPYYRPYAYPGYYGAYYGGYYAAPPPVFYAPPRVVIQPAPVYIERPIVEDVTIEAPGPSGPSEAAYWYYCSSARQYYPKVSTCREPWVKVLAEDR